MVDRRMWGLAVPPKRPKSPDNDLALSRIPDVGQRRLYEIGLAGYTEIARSVSDVFRVGA